MTKNELQRNIINILFDKDFAASIETAETEYSELELCSMVYRYAHTYDQCLNLLTLIKVNTDDKLLSAYITDIISAKKKTSELFHRSEHGCIYELSIVLDKYAATERYIFRDFEAAFEAIPKWHEHYGEEARQTTQYTVTKRRVLSAEDPLSEDCVAVCKLNKNREIFGYSSDTDGFYGNDCDGGCGMCDEEYCIAGVDIPFPELFRKGDLVYYDETMGINGYGVIFPEYSDAEEHYIVPLDSMFIAVRAFDTAMNAHVHIAKPYVRGADVSEIDAGKGTLGRLYREFLEHIGVK